MRKRITDGETMPVENEKSKKSSHKVLTAIITAAASVVLLVFYYFSLAFFSLKHFKMVMWAYMIALAVLALTYVIYNRGFSRKGVNVEMLPDEWSDEQKQSFIEDGELRIRRSKWMLVLIVAFFVTFAVEAWLLFVKPMLVGILGL